MTRAGLILVCVLATLVACDLKSPPEEQPTTQQRTDFAPEEFGIGRRHTPVTSCNRYIDSLLNKIRLCYREEKPREYCEALQKKNSETIRRTKHSARCSG